MHPSEQPSLEPTDDCGQFLSSMCVILAPMLDTSARLLSLLSLLGARPTWSGAALAERLEVDTRTVRRDIDRLRALGYPVRSTPGVGGGYRLGAGAEMPPLLLDEEEAVAVAVGLRTAASVGVTGIEETSVRALAKLEQVLPAHLRRRVGAIGSATVPFPSSGPTVDLEVLSAIATACRDHERLRFPYEGHDGAASRRLVEPHRLVHSGRRWYLVAWDRQREDWRTFRVDRIRARPQPDRRFLPREPPEPDIAAYVARGISAIRDRHQAVVLLRAPIAEAAPRVPAGAGTLEALDEHSCVLRVGSDWLGWLVAFVVEIGLDFEVLEPPELVRRIGELAARLARASAGRAP